MLFERGPVDLIPDDALPVPGRRGEIEAAAADQVRALGEAATAIGAQQSALASAGPLGVDGSVALALAAAADEHDRQSRDSDPAIGGVAAATDALEQELAGLTLTLADDLRTPEPGYPSIPPAAEPPPSPEHPPPDPETPEPGRIPGWPDAPPVERGGNGGTGQDWINLYMGYMRSDAQRIHGRDATGFEIGLPGTYHYWFGYVDDLAYNWLLSTYVAPYPGGFTF